MVELFDFGVVSDEIEASVAVTVMPTPQSTSTVESATSVPAEPQEVSPALTATLVLAVEITCIFVLI